LRVAAPALPFAEEYFDAIVSIDAYHNFGTSDLYLSYLARFLAPGGVLGVVVPGLVTDIDEVPAHLAPYWEPDFWSLHTPAWWDRHWRRSTVIDVAAADLLVDGWRDWAGWNETCAGADAGAVATWGEREARMLRADAGATLGLVRVVGRKPRAGGGMDGDATST
jgi:SAM-dependent methyltransferase